MQGILGKERKFSSGIAKLLGFYILQQPFFSHNAHNRKAGGPKSLFLLPAEFAG